MLARKIIFLDFDGVVHPAGQDVPLYWEQVISREEHFFLPGPVSRVCELCDVANAGIVISSTWRLEFPMSCFNSIFGGRVVGRTPLVRRIPAGIPMRWLEVQKYLSESPATVKYIIIDDQPDLFELNQVGLIATNPEAGFGEREFRMALEVFAD